MIRIHNITMHFHKHLRLFLMYLSYFTLLKSICRINRIRRYHSFQVIQILDHSVKIGRYNRAMKKRQELAQIFRHL